MWGRNNSKVCGGKRQLQTFTCAYDFATNDIARNCDGRRRCTISAYNNIMDQRGGGEKCPGVKKYLDVKYSCVPSKYLIFIDASCLIGQTYKILRGPNFNNFKSSWPSKGSCIPSLVKKTNMHITFRA